MFIVLEGLDGAGTTTQTARLAEALRARGRAVFATAEPTDGPVGQLLRRFLSGELEPAEAAQALLFAADRLHHLQTQIEPALAGGATVISDRYYLSNLAYQALSGRLDLDWLRRINIHARRPDLTIFLSVPPEVCRARLGGRGGAVERFDALEQLERIASAYARAIAFLRLEGERIETVDGQRAPEEVSQ